MLVLVPDLVPARHHGLLFGLPCLRAVGFFNEHFDPTQVWGCCLHDLEAERMHPFLCGAAPRPRGPRLHPLALGDHREVVARRSSRAGRVVALSSGTEGKDGQICPDSAHTSSCFCQHVFWIKISLISPVNLRTEPEQSPGSARHILHLQIGHGAAELSTPAKCL